ncbi:MAG: methyltransferase, partial [Pseudomonadota bacterium]
MSQAEEAPPVALAKLLFGSLVTQMIATAMQLDVPERLKNGPLSAEAIAAAAGSHPDATYRLLRALGSLGVLVEGPDRTFSLSPMGRLLVADEPGTLAGLARLTAEPWHHASLGQMVHSVRTGESGFYKVHGEHLFTWLSGRPRESSVFADAMTSFSNAEASMILRAYDFSAAECIVDVGGGNGLLLAHLLEANERARGVLLELPSVVEGARRLLTEHGVDRRIEIVPGDFFRAVPEGGDIYILKHVLHDWRDERAFTIVENVARAMPRGGRLLVIEQVLAPPGVSHFSKVLDVGVMVLTDGGRERTEREHAALLERAGLELSRVVPLAGPITILE